MSIPYSAEKDDLYYPAKHAVFFAAGRPKSEAALCAELSRLAYCNTGISFAFDRDRIRKVLAQAGFTDCRFFENTTKPACDGTHCFLAMEEDDKEIPVLAVVAFRGTDKDDPSDLIHDFNAWPESWKGRPGKVHTGFAEALAEVETDVLAALHAVKCRVLFTGHSLGAALATLLSGLRAPDSLYTFGSPRVGDGAFVATLNKIDNHRFVDCCDLVTQVPPKSFGYEHLGDPYYIDLSRRVRFNPPEKDIAEDRSRAELDYLENYAWRIGDVAVRSLADHAPINYVLPITMNTV